MYKHLDLKNSIVISIYVLRNSYRVFCIVQDIQMRKITPEFNFRLSEARKNRFCELNLKPMFSILDTKVVLGVQLVPHAKVPLICCVCF